MALQSTELRIGNIIYDSKGELKTVTAFDLINLECLEKNLHHDPRCKDWRGIELSEELLKKSGFEEGHSGKCLGIHGLWFYPVKGGFMLSDSEHYECIGIVLTFAHQLQNLVHSLTGNELEIKL